MKYRKLMLAGRAAWTVLALSMNYAVVTTEQAEQNFEKIYSYLPNISSLLYSIEVNPFIAVLMLGMCVWIYHLPDEVQLSKTKKIGMEIVAFVAAAGFWTGRAVYDHDRLEILFHGTVQCVKSLVILGGYWMLSRKLFYIFARGCHVYGNKKVFFEIKFFDNKYAGPFIFLVLMAVWGMVLFVYYPAMFMGDTEDIAYMAHGIYDITNHHPVMYTILLRVFMKMTNIQGGGNEAAFVCALFQSVVSAVILAYGSIYCARQLKRPDVAAFAVIFWAVCPWVSKYTIMLTKDGLFADFVLLLGIRLHKYCDRPGDRKVLWGVLRAAFMVFLLRKNGFYVLLFVFASLLCIYKKYWRNWAFCILICVAFYVGYSDIMLPVFGIPDGSVREALSVPFQQTARYVKNHADEVTEEERAAIDAVLVYEVLADAYTPDLSDPVKATFREDTGRDGLADYFKVWFGMFRKHPATYAAAAIENYYGYFYPVVNNIQKLYNTSVGSMENANRDGCFAFDNLYDDLHIWLRDFCSLYDMLWMRIPLLSLFATSAFYVWVAVVVCLFRWIADDVQGLAVGLLYVSVTLTALMGPCNAIDYERYIYPLILGFPVMLGILAEKRLSDRCSGSSFQ